MLRMSMVSWAAAHTSSTSVVTVAVRTSLGSTS